MGKYTNVCSLEEPKQIDFDLDTIFIRHNIKHVEIEVKGEKIKKYFYTEMQMNQMEYLEYLQKETIKSQQLQDDMILDNAYRVAVLELNNQSAL